jgi:hypothetical protein
MRKSVLFLLFKPLRLMMETVTANPATIITDSRLPLPSFLDLLSSLVGCNADITNSVPTSHVSFSRTGWRFLLLFLPFPHLLFQHRVTPLYLSTFFRFVAWFFSTLL